MYGIVTALVYQFTRFMGEITVYSDIGAWHCEFVYTGVHLCFDHGRILANSQLLFLALLIPLHSQATHAIPYVLAHSLPRFTSLALFTCLREPIIARTNY